MSEKIKKLACVFSVLEFLGIYACYSSDDNREDSFFKIHSRKKKAGKSPKWKDDILEINIDQMKM